MKHPLRLKTTSEEPRSLNRQASSTNITRSVAPMPARRDRTALELPWGGTPACCWGEGASACFGGGEAISLAAPPVSAWSGGGRGTSACAWGGGGRGTSASGVGTRAVSCAGRPQFGQNCSSTRSCCPQLLQYLSSTIIVPLLLNPKHPSWPPWPSLRLSVTEVTPTRGSS